MKKKGIQRGTDNALIQHKVIFTPADMSAAYKQGCSAMAAYFVDHLIPAQMAAQMAISHLERLLIRVDSLAPYPDPDYVKDALKGYDERLSAAFTKLTAAFRDIDQDIPQDAIRGVSARIDGIQALCAINSDHGESLKEAIRRDAGTETVSLFELAQHIKIDPGIPDSVRRMEQLHKQTGSERKAAELVSIETGVNFETLRKRYQDYRKVQKKLGG
jgi:hypothetical protein